jgi:hypothetical protein
MLEEVCIFIYFSILFTGPIAVSIACEVNQNGLDRVRFSRRICQSDSSVCTGRAMASDRCVGGVELFGTGRLLCADQHNEGESLLEVA